MSRCYLLMAMWTKEFLFTSATFRISVDQFVAPYILVVAATALAQPKYARVAHFPSWSYYYQVSECLLC